MAGPEPLSTAARRHVTKRGRPPKTPPAAAAAPGSSSSSSPAPAPTAELVPAAPPAPMAWEQLGAVLKGQADPIYRALGAELPSLEAWKGFACSWGRVVDHYLPAWQSTPLPEAVLCTVIIAAPLMAAYPEYKRRRDEARARAAAAIDGDGARPAVDQPPSWPPAA